MGSQSHYDHSRANSPRTSRECAKSLAFIRTLRKSYQGTLLTNLLDFEVKALPKCFSVQPLHLIVCSLLHHKGIVLPKLVTLKGKEVFVQSSPVRSC